MMRFLGLYILFMILSVGAISTDSTLGAASPKAGLMSKADEARSMYNSMGLDSYICFDAFLQCVAGSEAIERENRDIITVIDYSRPSTDKRMVVVDMRERRLLYSSVVSHGRNSGGNYATSFSNEEGSYKSSLGFYITENTYQGRNGFSLVLNGIEKGINDMAKRRAIVVHGAAYANPDVAASGRLGRSLGCPALPLSVCKPIINVIKGGTLMFIYANDRAYQASSDILARSFPCL